MGIYADLTGRGVSTRVAADLVGMPRATTLPISLDVGSTAMGVGMLIP